MQLSPGENAIPLAEAANRLGLSSEAVRKRITRGTLRGVKRGREWYVILSDAVSDASGHRPDIDDTSVTETLALLREQLAVKDQQIERHQTEVERLTMMLADAQVTIRGLLAPGDTRQPTGVRETYEDESPSSEEKTPQRGAGEGYGASARDAGEPAPKRRGWLARLFLGEE